MGLRLGWTDLDKWLVTALREYEQLTCRCGVHRDDAWDEVTASWIEVDTKHCYVCESLENHAKKRGQDNSRASIPVLKFTSEDDA